MNPSDHDIPLSRAGDFWGQVIKGYGHSPVANMQELEKMGLDFPISGDHIARHRAQLAAE